MLKPRVLYAETFAEGQRRFECVHAAPRSIVSELFAALLKKRLG